MAVAGDIVLLAGKGHERVRSSATEALALRRWLRRPGVRGMSPSGPPPRLPRPTEAVQGDFEVAGVTFDSREVQPGDLFVAMPGTVYDGHKFVEGAFAAGAAGADLFRRPVDGASRAGRGYRKGARETSAARRANVRRARIVGVTGSVGKTSTKEALYAALDRISGGKAHRSVKSYNNHTGVPLSLARMPRESRIRGARDGHEQQRRDRRADPAWSARTSRSSPRLPRRTSRTSVRKQAIADAKGEIFEGLEEGGTAIVPNDSPFRDRLVRIARRYAENILTFGHGDADVHAAACRPLVGRRKPDHRGAP